MPSDPRDYKLDVAGMDYTQSSQASQTRPHVSVHFRCCNVYCHIYRNAEGTAYLGRCPRCGRQVRFLVAEGGTDERFFVVE
jgi:hypothetical protein